MKDAVNKVTVVSAPTVPVAGLLGVAFVILKLCGVIGWSWWWVTAPFWGPAALVVAFLLGILAVAGIAWAVVACAALRSKE